VYFLNKETLAAQKIKYMGTSQSRETNNSVYCETEIRNVAPDEFEISLDAQAFEFHMLSPVKMLRVTLLDLKGHWGNTFSNVFTKQNPYDDEYVSISPNGNDKTQRVVKVTIKRDDVQLLYQSPRMRPHTILCHQGISPVLYVQMILKKQLLKRGTYEISDSAYLLCGNAYILIVTLPDEGVTIRPNMNQLMERSSIDPSLLFFASQPINEQHHHSQT